jgi:hypothetical protein
MPRNPLGSTNHRQAIQSAERCGCFYCLELFPPAAITQWIDEDERGVGQTALCPHCSIDAVIAESPEQPLSIKLLARMRLDAFGDL